MGKVKDMDTKESREQEILKCCICEKEIEAHPISGWSQGNNAEPVVKDGRCCDFCNDLVVIPERFKKVAWKMIEEWPHTKNKS
mgnify:CR=1 FL=1|tara:strand:- start:2654 stop:2902 length:249 start_codon:yes stop_codon:yes gene_type:complete